MKKKNELMFWVIIGVVLVAVIGWAMINNAAPNKLDGFAQCLKDKGAMFYGAFWCPHCQNQKALFGTAARLLPYTECSTPDGKGQLSICIEKKVTNYPTWRFADDSELTGEIALTKLAEKTGCTLPQ